MDEIIIREACDDDAFQILAYMKQIGAETDNLTFGAEGLPISIEEEQEYIRSVKESRSSVLYVAVKNGKIVGNGSLSGMPRRMSHRAELGISVLKEEWDKGIGNLLMQQLICYARNHEIEILNLEVRTDNLNAIHLYEKYGFHRIGVFPAFFKMDNKYVDFLLMYLDLRIAPKSAK